MSYWNDDDYGPDLEAINVQAARAEAEAARRDADLLAYACSQAKRTSKPRGEHAELKRITGTLAEPIREFCRAHVNKPFRAMELLIHLDALGFRFAPASPGRLLFQMRTNNEIDYTANKNGDYLVSWVAG